MNMMSLGALDDLRIRTCDTCTFDTLDTLDSQLHDGQGHDNALHPTRIDRSNGNKASISMISLPRLSLRFLFCLPLFLFRPCLAANSRTHWVLARSLDPASSPL